MPPDPPPQSPDNKAPTRSRTDLLAALGLVVLTLLALFIAYQPAAAYSVLISEQRSEVELQGAHAPERNDEVGDYRWTRAITDLQIRPIGAPITVHVQLQGWRPDANGNPEVRFSIDGRELARVPTSNALQQVDIYIPRQVAALSSLDLRMESATFLYPGDARPLGVILSGVSAESSGEPVRPNLPNRAPVGQAITGVLLAYAALRLAGTRWKASFLFALACLILLAASVAADRALVTQWGWLWVIAGLTLLAFGAYTQTLGRFFGAVAGAVRQGRLPGSQAAPPVGNAPSWLMPALVLAAALIIGLHLIAPLLPADEQPLTNYRWGLDFYSQLPAPITWVATILALLCLLPPVNSAVRSGASILYTNLQGYVVKLNPYWLLTATGAVASVIFWLLRNNTPLGDSVELVRKIELGYLWHEREQLDYYLHLKLTQAFAGWGATPLGIYQGISVLAGALAVIAILLIAVRLAAPGRRWIVAGFALATANMLLFAGYVESYTLVALVAILFLLALLLYLRNRAPAGIPAFLLALAMWLHPSAAFLAPALLAGLLLKRATWSERIRDAAVMLLAGLLLTMLVCTVFLAEGYSWSRWEVAQSQLGGVDPGLFKPLFEATGLREYYPIFSWEHLGAVLQEQLLIAPLALITIVLAAIGLRRFVGAGRDLAVLLVASLSTFLFSATWNPDLGAAKDWDLLSLPGIPLALLAGTILATHWPAAAANRRRVPAPLAYAASALILTSAWHALSWIVANAIGR